MPSSPRTPRHSRNSSAIDSIQASPQARRLSKSSMQDESSIIHQDSLELHMLGGVTASGNGMGNLADELADAFTDSEDGEDDEAGNDEKEGLPRHGETGENTDGQPNPVDAAATERPKGTTTGGSSVGDGGAQGKDGTLGIPSPYKRVHQRKGSEYDGSEYGSESDLDAAGMPPTLIAKIDAVESLARRGTGSFGGPADDVLQRVTDGLRDLGSQSTVEGSASSLTYPLLSPLAPPPDADTVDDVVPLLLSLSDAMPRPSTSAFNSLAALHSVTAELIQTLSYLSDTLHMSRQTTSTATRKLKSAKELVAEMRREDELREEGELWLSRGNWGERLQKRECAGVCGEVIGGFEDVCNGWRQRLLAQAEPKA
ncbi:hypothetical protein PLIIFM63780_004679 [Purpureocillium lilacinum]|nr:hypothetical protein PLIIFM63780_004679 [Purpureocillium lilacinum]